MSTFSFGFVGDDIENDELGDEHESQNKSQTELASNSVHNGKTLIPPQKHTLEEMVGVLEHYYSSLQFANKTQYSLKISYVSID